MTKLYIANTTKQDHQFTYRVKDQNGWKEFRIPAGGQVILTGMDMKEEHAREAIEQNLKYGLVHATDVDRTREFIGLCYELDKPVKADKIVEQFDRNDVVMDNAASDRLAATTSAISANLSDKIGQQMSRTEVEQVEDTPGKVDPSVAAGVETVAEGVEPRHKSRVRGRGKAG